MIKSSQCNIFSFREHILDSMKTIARVTWLKSHHKWIIKGAIEATKFGENNLQKYLQKLLLGQANYLETFTIVIWRLHSLHYKSTFSILLYKNHNSRGMGWKTSMLFSMTISSWDSNVVLSHWRECANSDGDNGF